MKGLSMCPNCEREDMMGGVCDNCGYYEGCR